MMGRSRGTRDAIAAALLLAVLAAFAATDARAIRLLANSSTAAYVQQVAKGGTGDDFENRTRAFERLRFDATDFAGANLSLHGFLTARNDLTSQNLGETRTRLYHGYLQYRPTTTGPDALRLDARAGRQWVAAGVGSGTLDGLLLRLDRGGLGSFTAFGGTLGSVRRDRGGFDKPSQSLRYGGELELHPRLAPGVDPRLGLSFAATRKDEQDDMRRIGGRASLRVRERLRIWSELRHDFLLEKTYGTSAGVEYLKRSKGIRAWAEYNRRTPALGATSVFAFFDTKEISDFRAGIGSRLLGPYAASFDFTRTDFKGGVNNVVLGDSVVTRAKVDRSKAFRFTVSRGAYSVGARFESGFAGDRTDLVLSGMHDFGEKIDLRVDLGYQDYDYGETDYENNTAASGIVALGYRLAPATKVTAQIEGLSNRDLSQDIRFLARVDQRFRLER